MEVVAGLSVGDLQTARHICSWLPGCPVGDVWLCSGLAGPVPA